MKKLFLLAVFIVFTSTNIFSQAIPKQIDYQGVLKTSAGTIVPDGNYQLTFKIYNDPTGGTPLWSEAQTVAVANGIFSAHLGSITPITTVPFNRIHFLGITIGADPELSPRTLLTPSPYSFMAINVMDNTVVKSLNSLKDDVNLVAGSNITITPSGNNLTISAAGGGGGTVTQVNTGAGLTGGPITTTGTISVANDGITTAMLQNNCVTSAKIVDGTITATDIGSSQVVKSLNSIKDNVNLVAGSNITITPSGQNITIASTAGGVGGSGTTNYLPKFTGSTTLGNSVISQDASGNITFGTNGSAGELRIPATDNVYEGGQIFWNGAGSYDDWYQDVYLNEMRIRTNSSNDDLVLIINNGSGKAGLGVEGNSGFGTITPSYPLHINANNSTASTYSVNTATGIYSAGVYGEAKQLDYYGVGGFFIGGWYGVYGSVIPSGSNFYYGVKGEVTGGTSPAGSRYGVYGTASGTGTGLRYGVYGTASGGTTNYAGYFAGNVNVTGTLSKGGGSFKIDHPLDPANKYLYHSFVESPDMKNIYDGTVTTDASGNATVTLPDWFEALNKDFRYQLTVIGDFAQAIIAQEIQGNQFAIRTDKPNVKVSWQVTGIRKDAFAEKNRIPVEELKQGDDAGKYIHPDAFGLPETMGIDYEKNNPDKERNSK
jgi:hypothetical protein